MLLRTSPVCVAEASPLARPGAVSGPGPRQPAITPPPSASCKAIVRTRRIARFRAGYHRRERAAGCADSGIGSRYEIRWFLWLSLVRVARGSQALGFFEYFARRPHEPNALVP